MAIPKYDECMKPLLEEIKDGRLYKMKEVQDLLAKRLQLSEDELSQMLDSGRQSVFKNHVGWATTYLKKAGLITYPVRAVIQITDDGLKVLKENPDKIDMKYLSRFESFREFAKVKEASPQPETIKDQSLTPDDKLSAAYADINATLASDLLDEVMKVSSYAFEKMVVDLLIQMGYSAPEYGSHTTVAAGDDGIDGVIMEDKLGFSLIYMQAKLWARDRTVGQPELQNFVGAIAGKKGDGLFVTTAKFSQKARDYAEKHHIILIDGDRLAKLMIENNFCVSVKKRIEIKALDTDMLSEYQDG